MTCHVMQGSITFAGWGSTVHAWAYSSKWAKCEERGHQVLKNKKQKVTRYASTVEKCWPGTFKQLFFLTEDPFNFLNWTPAYTLNENLQKNYFLQLQAIVALKLSIWLKFLFFRYITWPGQATAYKVTTQIYEADVQRITSQGNKNIWVPEFAPVCENSKTSELRI